jgi:hypothetical protein
LSFATLSGKLRRREWGKIEKLAKLWILDFADETNIMEYLRKLREDHRLDQRRKWAKNPILPLILLAYKAQKCYEDSECTFKGCLRGHTGKDLLTKEQFLNGGLDDVPCLPWGIRSINQCYKKERDERHEAARRVYVRELEEAKGSEEDPPATWERPENPDAHIQEYWEVEARDLADFLGSLDPDDLLKAETYQERKDRQFQRNIDKYGSTILRAIKTHFHKCRVTKTHTEDGWTLKTAARRWIPVIRATGGVEGYLESLRSGEAKEPEMPTGIQCHVADCDFVCASESALKKHNKKYHETEEKGVEDEPNVVVKAYAKTSRVLDDLICPHCNVKCQNRRIWKRHVLRHVRSDDESDSKKEDDWVDVPTYTRGGAGGAGGLDLAPSFISGEAQLFQEEEDAEEEAASMVITLTLEKHTRAGSGKKGDKPSTTWSLSFEGAPQRLIPRMLPLLRKIDGPFSKLNKQLKTIKTKPGKHFGDDQISQCRKIFESVCPEHIVILKRD